MSLMRRDFFNDWPPHHVPMMMMSMPTPSSSSSWWLDPFDSMFHHEPHRFLRDIDQHMREMHTRMLANVPPRYFVHDWPAFPSTPSWDNWDEWFNRMHKEMQAHMPRVSNDGQSVSLNVNLPDYVDPNKVNVSASDREVIVQAEDKVVAEKDNSTRAYSYYHRSSFPPNSDLKNVKAFIDNGKDVSIQAPLHQRHNNNNNNNENRSQANNGSIQIPIQHGNK